MTALKQILSSWGSKSSQDRLASVSWKEDLGCLRDRDFAARVCCNWSLNMNVRSKMYSLLQETVIAGFSLIEDICYNYDSVATTSATSTVTTTQTSTPTTSASSTAATTQTTDLPDCPNTLSGYFQESLGVRVRGGYLFFDERTSWTDEQIAEARYVDLYVRDASFVKCAAMCINAEKCTSFETPWGMHCV